VTSLTKQREHEDAAGTLARLRVKGAINGKEMEGGDCHVAKQREPEDTV